MNEIIKTNRTSFSEEELIKGMMQELILVDLRNQKEVNYPKKESFWLSESELSKLLSPLERLY